jgi:hypothetical protein
VEKKLQGVLAKSGKSHFCVILGLLAVVVFLVLLIVYT